MRDGMNVCVVDVKTVPDAPGILERSVGCYYDYQVGQVYWFDPSTLEGTIHLFALRHPLLVTYNGRAEVFPVMQAVLTAVQAGDSHRWDLPERFAALCATSYDIRAELVRSDPPPQDDHARHALGALARANGLSPTALRGPTAPSSQRAGRAEVRLACQQDVLRIKGLFDRILAGQALRRGDGSAVLLPRPPLLHTEG